MLPMAGVTTSAALAFAVRAWILLMPGQRRHRCTNDHPAPHQRLGGVPIPYRHCYSLTNA
jgi:hypothetical protein